MDVLPPIALEVIALTDEVRAHLVRGKLASRTVTKLSTRGSRYDAEFAARLVLADVEHCLADGEAGDGLSVDERWRQLAAQLGAIERAVGSK
jgi:hypothetical protein